MTLDKALEESEDLANAYRDDEAVTAIIDMARKLEGVARNAGKHAGGVVIAPTELTDFAPLYCEPGGANLVTQYDKDDVEQAGLVKFDFLGLRTLTIIDWALPPSTPSARSPARRRSTSTSSTPRRGRLRAAAALRDHRRVPARIPRHEGADQEAPARQLRGHDRAGGPVPPGPLQSGMVDDFCDRKHGRADVAYPHPKLEPILKPTYGVILYQEQVMQIAQVLAGYSLGGADLLRRAMGKKKVEEMDKQRAIFEQGAGERGVEAQDRHLHLRPDGEVRRLRLQQVPLRRLRAGVLPDPLAQGPLSRPPSWPPCCPRTWTTPTRWSRSSTSAAAWGCRWSRRRSTAPSTASPSTGRTPWSTASAPSRGRRVRHRVHPGGPRRRPVQGPLGSLPPRRPAQGQQAGVRGPDPRRRAGRARRGAGGGRRLAEPATAQPRHADEPAARGAEARRAAPRAAIAGQADLFGALLDDPAAAAEPDPQIAAQTWPDWDEDERLLGEKETLGLYLTGHPINRFDAELNALVSQRIGAAAGVEPGLVDASVTPLRGGDRDLRTVAGLVHQMQVRKTARGRMASLTLDDRTGRIEVTCFNDVYDRVRDLLQPDAILVVSGNLRPDEYTGGVSLIAREVQTLEQARAERAEHLLLQLDLSTPPTTPTALELVQQLHALLQPYGGEGIRLRLDYRRPAARGSCAAARTGASIRRTPC
jgi:DNA polymerase-3 subunit alpha